MTTVLFARHGQTDWNLEMRRQGRTDIPLNDTGRMQAVECAQKIDIPVDVICSSPLCRALETARIIAGHIGYDRPVEIVDGLMERSFGQYEGTCVDRLPGGFLWEMNSPFNRGLEDPKEAETLPVLFTRIDGCLTRLCRLYAGKTILLVSHGGVAVAVRRYFEGAPKDGDYKPLIPPNTCLLRYHAH